MRECPDLATSACRLAVGSGGAKRAQDRRRLLLTLGLTVDGEPTVVVKAMAKQSCRNPGNSEGTCFACGDVSEHVADAPLTAERLGVPLLVVQPSQSIYQIQHLVAHRVRRHCLSILVDVAGGHQAAVMVTRDEAR